VGAPAAEIVRVPIIGISMSADGQWFGGHDGLGNFAQAGDQAAIWSRNQGLTRLGIPTGHNSSQVTGLSADGSKVVGSAPTSGRGAKSEAFLWTAADGMTGLRSLLPGSSSSFIGLGGISDDGSTVVGTASYSTGEEIWLLSSNRQLTSLGLPEGTSGVGGVIATLHVSGDGRRTAGEGRAPGIDDSRIFTWDSDDGFQFVSQPGFTSPRISADGNYVVAYSKAFNSPSTFRWSRDGGVTPIPTLSGHSARFDSYDINADGSIIVGEVSRRAVVWDGQNGTQDLRQLLIDEHGFSSGVLPPQLTAAFNISSDGMTLDVTSDTAYRERWAIYLDKPLVNVVPEPSTWALGCVCGIALFVASGRGKLWRRRC
jgi:uncharacterized membrane protein